MIREDLRAERNRIDGLAGGGGDFHSPFWSDAKSHVIGLFELTEQTSFRIDQLEQRKRLYPVLCDGFLKWFGDLKKKTNQTVGWHQARVHNRFKFPNLDLTIKVENLMGLHIGQDRHLLVYPYFSENPTLSEKWGRVGLWLMAASLPDFDPTEMHLLDVIRARSFSGASTFLIGDEESIFIARYQQLFEEWMQLRSAYGLT
jgi:hypothetical protein